MALVDPYSPCPCGSGRKFKWCCHKAEASAIRVERMIVNEQFDQALRAVDDALAKEPDVLWLLSQKEYLHDRKGEYAEARKAAERMTALMPDHEAAWLTRVRLAILADGTRAGIDELQRGLAACDTTAATAGPKLRRAAGLLGAVLYEKGDHVPALAHLYLGAAEDESDEEDDAGDAAAQALNQLLTDPRVSPWAKADYSPADAPDDLSPDVRKRFEQALADAQRGLWSRAAARFETLAADGVAGADKNLGLCRLWIGDNAGGAAALRRHIARLGSTTEAVDLEALAQLDEPVRPQDLDERVRLTWTLRNRDGLIAALQRETEARRALDQGEEPTNPDDPKSPKIRVFGLLSGPVPDARSGLTLADLPALEVTVLVGPETASIEAIDDAQLNARRDRFIDLAGHNIPPAHPKLKVVERVPRHVRALQSEIVVPGDLPRDEFRRLMNERQRQMLRDRWISTPVPYLRGRTPQQAAAASDAEIPLRAALCLLDGAQIGPDSPTAEVRAELGLPAEPPIDAIDTEGLLALHAGRLGLLRVDNLDDQQLDLLRARGAASGQLDVAARACRAWLDRPQSLDARPAPERFAVFADLVRVVLTRESPNEALDLIERGRRDEPAAHRAENAVRWDMLEVRARTRSEEPEKWVPVLATVLERYRDRADASPTILQGLLELGLIRPAVHPDRPDQTLLDSRPLAMLLERYGPRVVTADGALGVSAGKSEIWTPEKAAGGGSGGLWTPGSSATPADKAEGSKLFIPGR